MKIQILSLMLVLSASGAWADACCSVSVPAAASTNALPDHSLFHLEGEWSNQKGETVSLVDFAGKPSLITMFFSSCGYACPILIQDMKNLRSQLPLDQQDQLNILLLSFDSERDLPAALAEFATQRDLETPPWVLMHGDEDVVLETSALLGVRFRKDDKGNFAHSNLITLLNAQGEVVYKLEGLRADSAPLLEAIKTLFVN